MRAPARQRGVLLIAAVVLIAVAAVMAAVIVTLTAGSAQSGGQHLGSTQALYAAESGLERAIGYSLSPTTTNRSTCAAIPSGTTDIPSIGQFQISGPASTYVANSITLVNVIAAATASPINIVRVSGNTAQLAASGRVLIDREAFEYQSIGTVDADCGGAVTAPCLRGVIRARDGTTAAAHAANTRIGQYQCTVTSTGGVPDVANPRGQRVLSQGIQQQEGWAVGDSPNQGVTRATLLRWNGVSWSDASATLPAQTNRHLYAVSALSYADVWTVGNTGGGGGACSNNARIAKWNGSAWVCDSTTPTGQRLNSVSMLSANVGWAVGNNGSIVYWNGANWAEQNGGAQPRTARELHSVHTLAPNEVWITGRDENAGGKTCANGSPIVLRYTGAWSCPNTNLPLQRFRAIFMFPDGADAGTLPDDGWIVGDRNGGNFTIYRWNKPTANQWNDFSVNSGDREQLNSVYALDTDGDGLSDDGWAVGNTRNNKVNILRWNHACAGGVATGLWAVCSFDPGVATQRVNLNSVFCANANDCWTVGESLNAGTDPPVMFHWNGSSWTYVAPPAGVTRHLRGVAIIGARTRPQAAWREVFP